MSSKKRPRKRTTTAPAARPSAAGQPRGGGRPRDPGFRQARDTIIDSLQLLGDQAEVADAYTAEVAISVVLGVMVQAGKSGDRLASVLLDVVDELVRRSLPHSYPVLRALAVAGSPEISGYAAQAADRMGRVQAPDWVEDLGQVTPGTCTLMSDAYGETQVVLCEFAYADGAHSHGVFAVVDATWHGAVTELAIDDTPAKTRQSIMKRARRDGLELCEITGQEAGTIFLAGIDAFLRHGRPPGANPSGDKYRMMYSGLCLARSRAAMIAPPAPDAKLDDIADSWPQEARQRLVTEFLDSSHARDLDGFLERTMPFLIITTCVNQLGCDPLTIGPVLLERMLLTVLPTTLLGPDRFGAGVAVGLRAWTAWLAERNAMPARQRKQLMFQLEYLLREFEKLWISGKSGNPLRRYVQDLPDEVAGNGDRLSDVIDRRTFAVPQPDDRGQGLAAGQNDAPPRDAYELDAADARDRALITLLRLSARGLPQQRFAAYLPVIEQLWAGEPAEVWAAAQRMRDAGLSRDKILDRLARS